MGANAEVRVKKLSEADRLRRKLQAAEERIKDLEQGMEYSRIKLGEMSRELDQAKKDREMMKGGNQALKEKCAAMADCVAAIDHAVNNVSLLVQAVRNIGEYRMLLGREEKDHA